VAKSEAYARIKADVYAIARAIPEGQLTTFAAIGEFLDVVPRQVAYLLALRNDEAREATQWHRVMSDGGVLGRVKYDAFGRSQAALLEADGLNVATPGRVIDFEQRFFAPTTENTGVVPVPRAKINTTRSMSEGRSASPRRRSS
jgi:alkylated DNA nucleotide flippase Atl1